MVKENLLVGVGLVFIISVIVLVFMVYGGSPRGLYWQVQEVKSTVAHEKLGLEDEFNKVSKDNKQELINYLAEKDKQLAAYNKRLSEILVNHNQRLLQVEKNKWYGKDKTND